MSNTVSKNEYLEAISAYLHTKAAVEEDTSLSELVQERDALTNSLMELLAKPDYNKESTMALSRELTRIRGILTENEKWLAFLQAEEEVKTVLQGYACNGSCATCQNECAGKGKKE